MVHVNKGNTPTEIGLGPGICIHKAAISSSSCSLCFFSPYNAFSMSDIFINLNNVSVIFPHFQLVWLYFSQQILTVNNYLIIYVLDISLPSRSCLEFFRFFANDSMNNRGCMVIKQCQNNYEILVK